MLHNNSSTALPRASNPAYLTPWVCWAAAAVLGRFVYALNVFCKEAYGMEYDVSDYWVYEFAKVGAGGRLPTTVVRATADACRGDTSAGVSRSSPSCWWQQQPACSVNQEQPLPPPPCSQPACSWCALRADLELLPGSVKPHRARLLQVGPFQRWHPHHPRCVRAAATPS